MTEKVTASQEHGLPAQEKSASETSKNVPAAMNETLRAWLRVTGCFLVLANTMGLQSSFGVFQEYYTSNLLSDSSQSDVAWIGTIQIFCSAAGGLLSGPLFDKGYDRICVALGCFFGVFAYLMLSLSTEYYQIFLAQGICGGVAGTFVFSPCVALTSISFQRQRSLAVGITTSGFAVGAVIYPIVFRSLQPAIGFGWTCRVFALIALLCFLIAYPLIYWNTPRQAKPPRKFLDLSAWKEAPYTVYALAVCLMFAGYWPPYFFMTTFVTTALGGSSAMAFYIFAISNAANAISRVTATIAADKLGRIEVLVFATFASATVVLCWPAVTTTTGMIAWSVFWGYSSGTASACFAAIVPEFCPGPETVGTRLGMVNGLFGFSALISPPIAGAIISAANAASPGVLDGPAIYLGMQLWSGACWFVALCLFIYPLAVLRRRRAPLACKNMDAESCTECSAE